LRIVEQPVDFRNIPCRNASQTKPPTRNEIHQTRHRRRRRLAVRGFLLPERASPAGSGSGGAARKISGLPFPNEKPGPATAAPGFSVSGRVARGFFFRKNAAANW
jgi:hypothetical protein